MARLESTRKNLERVADTGVKELLRAFIDDTPHPDLDK